MHLRVNKFLQAKEKGKTDVDIRFGNYFLRKASKTLVIVATETVTVQNDHKNKDNPKNEDDLKDEDE